MQYERIYADAKGETHFEKAALKLDEADYGPPSPTLYVSHAREAGTLQFIRLPSGWIGDGVRPPQQQFFICLQGELEMHASDGKKRTFGPGDAVLMEDTSGRGHTSRVKGGKNFIAAIVSLE